MYLYYSEEKKRRIELLNRIDGRDASSLGTALEDDRGMMELEQEEEEESPL
jgi:hypothetical protein